MQQIKKFKVYISSLEGEGIDITNIIVNVSISETLKGDLSGHIEIDDAMGMLDTVISSSRTITVAYEYLEIPYLNKFYIDGVSNADLSSNTNTKSYVINLQSVNNAANSIQLLQRSYKGLGSEMIVKIYKEFFGEKSILYSGDCKTQGKYIVPTLSPKRACDVIRRNILDTTGAPFVLFQRMIDKGLTILTSLNWLIKNQQSNWIIEIALPSKEKVANDLADVGKAEKVIVVSDNAGTLTKAMGGVFGKTTNELDLNNSTNNLDNYGLNNNSMLVTIPYLKNKYSNKERGLLNQGEETDRLHSNSVLDNLDNTKIKAITVVAIPGLGVGHTIGLDVNINSPKDLGKSNKFSDNYMVAEIIHNIRDNVYTQDITMVKP